VVLRTVQCGAEVGLVKAHWPLDNRFSNLLVSFHKLSDTDYQPQSTHCKISLQTPIAETCVETLDLQRPLLRM
jgi:hypothetical protein